MQQKGFVGQWSWAVKYGDRRRGPPKIREERTAARGVIGQCCFFVLLPLDIDTISPITNWQWEWPGKEPNSRQKLKALLPWMRIWYQPHGLGLGSYFICCEIKLGEGPRVSYWQTSVHNVVCLNHIRMIVAMYTWATVQKRNVIVWKYYMVGSYMEDSRIPHNSENWRVGTHTAHVGQYCTSVATTIVLISHHNISSGCTVVSQKRAHSRNSTHLLLLAQFLVKGQSLLKL